MEALLSLLAAIGFPLMQRDRLHAGLALVGVTPLVHPNGLFLCAGAGVYAVLQWLRHPERRAPSATGAILLTLSAAAWLGYLAYVAAHWHDFLDDMLFQLSWRGVSASGADLDTCPGYPSS